MLTSAWFQIIGATIISSLIGIFVKYASRNDTFSKSFRKEDLAIGMEMMVTSIILLITRYMYTFNKSEIKTIDNEIKIGLQNEMQIALWMIFVFSIGLWGISTIVRKKGWYNENELNIGWGIVFPNIIGVASLICVFILIR